MSARKTTPRRPVTGSVLTDRATLDLVVAAAVAAVRQAEAAAEWANATGDEPNAQAIFSRAREARIDTCRAGKALADALRKTRGGK